METLLITPRTVGAAKTMPTKIIADEGIFFSDIPNEKFVVDVPVEVAVEDRETNGKQFKFIVAFPSAVPGDVIYFDAGKRELELKLFQTWASSPYVANQMRSENEVVGLVKKLTMKSLEVLK